MITQEELKFNLSYDPETGVFTRLVIKRNSRVPLGPINTGQSREGYRIINLDQKKYKAHRLAFLYMTGEFPSKHVDHVDGNRSNNVWHNLRQATQAENNKNSGIRKNNTTGYRGVSRYRNKWKAQAQVNKQKHSIGYFNTPQEASDAYESFAKANFLAFYRKP